MTLLRTRLHQPGLLEDRNLILISSARLVMTSMTLMLIQAVMFRIMTFSILHHLIYLKSIQDHLRRIHLKKKKVMNLIRMRKRTAGDRNVTILEDIVLNLILKSHIFLIHIVIGILHRYSICMTNMRLLIIITSLMIDMRSHTSTRSSLITCHTRMTYPLKVCTRPQSTILNITDQSINHSEDVTEGLEEHISQLDMVVPPMHTLTQSHTDTLVVDTCATTIQAVSTVT